MIEMGKSHDIAYCLIMECNETEKREKFIKILHETKEK